MKILKKLSSLLNRKISAPTESTVLADRIALLERNYLVLLKRVLEIDGIKLVTNKASALNSRILQTPNEDNHKGLHDREPTIH